MQNMQSKHIKHSNQFHEKMKDLTCQGDENLAENTLHLDTHSGVMHNFKTSAPIEESNLLSPEQIPWRLDEI